jgi:uncharacterized membrane protein YphA (DoxX/SURF4 family)
MRTDERISSTKRSIASRGFGIWYVLLLASLLYRQFVLRQTIDQYWDIAVVFLAGALYVSVSLFARGAVVEDRIMRSFKVSIPTILLTILAVTYLAGGVTSLSGLLITAVSALIGVSSMMILFYLLYRHWERGIDAH